MTVPTSVRIAELRREIEGIQELNQIFRGQKYHSYRDQTAKEKRKIRLQEIMQQLATLRPRNAQEAVQAENSLDASAAAAKRAHEGRGRESF